MPFLADGDYLLGGLECCVTGFGQNHCSFVSSVAWAANVESAEAHATASLRTMGKFLGSGRGSLAKRESRPDRQAVPRRTIWARMRSLAQREKESYETR